MADHDEQPADSDPVAIEREVEQLEERLQQADGAHQQEMSNRLRRMRRRARESAPDALFKGTDEHGMRGIARRTDSYGFVLLMLAALIWLFVPLASAERWAVLPTLVVFWAAILLSLHTSFIRASRLRLAIVVTSAFLACGIVGYLVDSNDLRAIADMGFGVMLILTATVVLRRILSHQSVTSRTLSGGVSVFLFVGLAFASVAAGVEQWWPGSYTTANGGLGFPSMLYFSFVTLATLGYGDIVPVSSFARSLATLEAVMGQIYLVTIVARLVSLLGLTRVDPGDPDPGEAPPADPDPTST